MYYVIYFTSTLELSFVLLRSRVEYAIHSNVHRHLCQISDYDLHTYILKRCASSRANVLHVFCGIDKRDKWKLQEKLGKLLTEWTKRQISPKRVSTYLFYLENAIFFPNKSYSSFIELKSKHQLIPLFRSQLYVLFFCLCWIWWKKCKKMKSKSVNNRITEMYKPAIKWLQWKWLQLYHVLVYDLDKMV